MSDQERTGKAKKDEDEAETSAEETSEEEGSDEEEDEREEGEEEDGEEEDGEEPADGADAARAQRVADALGVGAEEQAGAKGEADAEAPAAPPNRSSRRAEASQRRKQRKGAGDKSEKSTDEEAPLPRDKNARAKELLKRRKEQAAEARPIQLLPGEMVDDALARSSSAVGKWIRDNWTGIQWVILAGLVAGGGYVFYQTRVDKSAAGTTDELMVGINADRGRVIADDKRSDEEKEIDPTKVFKTADERSDNALAAYKKVAAAHPGTPAALLARLGEAGDQLDKHDWAGALEGFSAVSSSTLATTDPDVKARALEGHGFAKEGKGDLDGALANFKELEGVAGYKELGLYQQGRLWLAKGDKDKAKDFLKQAREKLEQPTAETSSLHYLQVVVDQALRRIDPSLVPNKDPAIGGPKGGSMTADELEKLKRKLQEAMKQKGDQHE